MLPAAARRGQPRGRVATGDRPAIARMRSVMLSGMAGGDDDTASSLQIALAKPCDARFAPGAELATALSAAEQGALPEPLLRRARRLGQQLAWTEPERTEPRAG